MVERAIVADDGGAADVMYDCYADRFSGGLDSFRAQVAGWDIAYLKVGGAVAGAAVRRSGELHIGILKEWRRRWATRGFIRAILAWAAETGAVVTGVATGNEAGKRLVEGVGFRLFDCQTRGNRYELSTDAI